MKTVSVKLSEELAVRLEKRAKRLGRSKSAVIREAIEQALRESNFVEEEPSMYELMKEGCGYIDSGIKDLATNPKHMEGFGR